MLDLERCPFLRPMSAFPYQGASIDGQLGCWSDGAGEEIAPTVQRDRCQVLAHTTCSRLLAVLSSQPPRGWWFVGNAARMVAESSHLAEARLEVQSERLEPTLARIFGG